MKPEHEADKIWDVVVTAQREYEAVKSERENDAITTMLKCAAEHGLETEAVWSLCNEIRQTPTLTIEEAAWRAICEWDL